jgi:hypothetical protein
MVRDRFMLCEDVPAELARLITAGLTRGVPTATGTLPVARFPACEQRKGGRDHHDDKDHDDDDKEDRDDHGRRD